MNPVSMYGASANVAFWTNTAAKAHKNDAETTGAIANNKSNDPIFKQNNVETTGAVAMFNGSNGGLNLVA